MHLFDKERTLIAMKFKSIVLAVATVFLLGTTVYTIVRAPGSRRSATATAATIQKSIPGWGSRNLKNVALQVASECGDPHPTVIQYIKSDRIASYIVIMHGNFTDEMASRPPGAQAPAGNTLCLYIRAADGTVTGLILNSQLNSDLGQWGPVADISTD